MSLAIHFTHMEVHEAEQQVEWLRGKLEDALIELELAQERLEECARSDK